MKERIVSKRIWRLVVALLVGFGFLALGIPLFFDDPLHKALLWNVFLAALPLPFALGITWGYKNKKPAWLLVVLGLFWLALLPNAPYMLTDLMHIHIYEYYIGPTFTQSRTAWLGLFHISFAVLMGCMWGNLALWYVHSTVRARFGRVWGWLFCMGICLMCGVGMFIGRFLRLNTWDLLHPAVFLKRLGEWVRWHSFAVSLVFAAMAAASYALFYFCFDTSCEKGE